MAKNLIDNLENELGKKGKCITHKIPLHGWISTKRRHWNSWSIVAMENLTIRYKLPEDVAKHLLRYGKNYLKICEEIDNQPGLVEKISDERPNILAEIDYNIKNEKVVSLNDVMLRRTQLQLSENQGLDCVEKVARRMAYLLGWSAEKEKHEIENYRHSLVWNP